ncbi:DEAD/DEAH box helicase [Vibrio splendidus]|uniref:DEAD/DEAH box helicase n=1 Tax=Vibrio splendidus TaxID=29497 RepID=UPI000C8395F1|nr:DEAD/DEAH box helicase [Vibrio splendidus]PMM09289.1 DEAD/DEAH box helicase [Vibrio splendidus]PMN25819.1 DEAD/DEAH box helicase [Vibrio splendidus]
MIDAHTKLDRRIQKWIFNQGWYSLREIQCKAIAPILAGNTDVLISASTAAGKTEAFFLPAISKMLNGGKTGVNILYISPLKALINDQDRRLESLADLTDVTVTPWHGDSSKGRKNKLKKSPAGIVLITPESLESMLIRDAGWVREAFSKLDHIVIDEFHAFLGTERGHHLVSLLHRLEHLLGRLESPIPRTALSATLGNIENVPVLLRPNQSLPCRIIRDSQSTTSLKVQVKAYVEPKEISEKGPESAETQVCRDLFKFCRGDSHLVFANSRKRTESLAATLTDFCDEAVVPNEFFPHHGSLAKELREDLERRLQNEQLPTTAICTMTLELGIDIGKVNSVIQVTAPHSVSSLRQRMGRSGRRGGPSVLRMLITEDELEKNSDVVSKLRLQLIQSLAMIRLLIRNKWYEPADTDKYHFSTLLHQILSVVAQWGGVRADQLFTLLCKNGVFQKINANQFKTLLIHMGQQDLITQLESGELSLGLTGERLVSHYSFFAVFKTPEEYRVVNGDKTLGSLPVDSLIMTGQHIVFGGKRWKVLDVDPDKKVISVEYARGGQAPKFGGGGLIIHDEIRKEMFNILLDGDYRISIGNQKVDFVDATAKELFTESIEYFNAAGLAKKSILQVGKSTCIFTWMGDKVVNTIAALLINLGYEVGNFAGVLIVEDAKEESIEASLKQILLDSLPTEQSLANSVRDKCTDKFDEYLPEDILALNFGAAAFNIEKARLWLKNVVVD